MAVKTVKVKSVKMEEFERKLWTDKNAVITTTDSDKWVYSLEYNDRTWKNQADYLDNAKSDFISEADPDIETTELFYRYDNYK